MAENWIVVANNSGARILTLAPPAPRLKDPPAGQIAAAAAPPARLVQRESLDHPQGRMKAQAIDADRPGRAFQSAGKMRHSKTREVDPKSQEAIAFAGQVADRLEKGRKQGELERLILVVAPEFLGLLRAAMSAALRRLVELEISRDLAQMTPAEIRAHLPQTLFGAARS